METNKNLPTKTVEFRDIAKAVAGLDRDVAINLYNSLGEWEPSSPSEAIYMKNLLYIFTNNKDHINSVCDELLNEKYELFGKERVDSFTGLSVKGRAKRSSKSYEDPDDELSELLYAKEQIENKIKEVKKKLKVTIVRPEGYNYSANLK